MCRTAKPVSRPKCRSLRPVSRPRCRAEGLTGVAQ